MGNGMFIFLIILVTAVVTYMGLRDYSFKTRYLLHVDRILRDKQYYRMISSGFMHADWMHFGFNMIALFHMGQIPGTGLGWLGEFFLLYFGSMLAGSALAVYFHRNHGDYTAWGASGAVSGVVLAYCIHAPLADLTLFFIPIPFPAWLMGLAWVLVSIFGTRNQWGNIGHEAHLGGAIFGVLVTVLLNPTVAITNWWMVLLCLIPFGIFMYLVLKRPSMMVIGPKSIKDAFKRRRDKAESRGLPQQFKRQAAARKQFAREINRTPQEELDELLEKVSSKGLKSLTPKERQRLDELSKRL